MRDELVYLHLGLGDQRPIPYLLRDAGVTSLSAGLGRPVAVTDMVGAMERHLADVLG